MVVPRRIFALTVPAATCTTQFTAGSAPLHIPEKQSHKPPEAIISSLKLKTTITMVKIRSSNHPAEEPLTGNQVSLKKAIHQLAHRQEELPTKVIRHSSKSFGKWEQGRLRSNSSSTWRSDLCRRWGVEVIRRTVRGSWISTEIVC